MATWSPPGFITKTLGGAPAAFTAATGVPYYVPIAVIVVLIVVITIVIIYAVKSAQTAPAVSVEGPIDLFSPKDLVIVDRSVTRTTLKNSYTLAFFLNITAVPDMRVQATPILTWPGVWTLGYNAGHEKLVWDVSQVMDISGTPGIAQKIALPNVPMQRCTQIAITFEGRSFDFYINGALAESITLRNMPYSSTSSITKVPNGVMGNISYIQSWPRRLTMGEVTDNYNSVSDSQGCPLLTKSLFSALFTPNLFCPSGNCNGTSPTASPSQIWEFPYQ
jgi:hypothetical protein